MLPSPLPPSSSSPGERSECNPPLTRSISLPRCSEHFFQLIRAPSCHRVDWIGPTPRSQREELDGPALVESVPSHRRDPRWSRSSPTRLKWCRAIARSAHLRLSGEVRDHSLFIWRPKKLGLHHLPAEDTGGAGGLGGNRLDDETRGAVRSARYDCEATRRDTYVITYRGANSNSSTK